MTYREMTAPDLVKQWRRLVNDYVNMGRDSHLIKQELQALTPVQILLGMYRCKGQATLSIPQFLRQKDKWLEDEAWAEVELARFLTNTSPPSYYVFMDTINEEDVASREHFLKASASLFQWADGVVS